MRAAEATHKAAVKRATQLARQLIEADGSKASNQVMDAVRETLDILPGSDIPGRLTKPLKRTGFEALEGFTFSAKPRPAATRLEPRQAAPKVAPTPQEKRANEAAERDRAMTKERLRFAEATERETEAALERATRAAERAERTLDRVQREFDEAARNANDLRKEAAAAKAAHDHAVAERERLAQKIS